MRVSLESPEDEEKRKINKFKNMAIDVYRKYGKEELIKYLEEVDIYRKEERRKQFEFQNGHNMTNAKIFVHCPKCGYRFQFLSINDGKITGGIGGFSAGALLGAKIGIAMGPLGAIAGTIPGAILGGLFGKNIGNNFDNPICPNCSTKFQAPNNLEYDISELKTQEMIRLYEPISVDEIIYASKKDIEITSTTTGKLVGLREKLSNYKKME